MAFVNTLYKPWPNGDGNIPGLRDGVAVSAPAVFQKYRIHSPLLVARVHPRRTRLQWLLVTCSQRK
jgi:hypothetical protein